MFVNSCFNSPDLGWYWIGFGEHCRGLGKEWKLKLPTPWLSLLQQPKFNGIVSRGSSMKNNKNEWISDNTYTNENWYSIPKSDVDFVLVETRFWKCSRGLHIEHINSTTNAKCGNNKCHIYKGNKFFNELTSSSH